MEKGKFRKIFEDFEAQPPEGIENNIFSDLRKKKKRRALIWWTSGSGVFSLLIALTYFLYSGKEIIIPISDAEVAIKENRIQRERKNLQKNDKSAANLPEKGLKQFEERPSIPASSGPEENPDRKASYPILSQEKIHGQMHENQRHDALPNILANLKVEKTANRKDSNKDRGETIDSGEKISSGFLTTNQTKHNKIPEPADDRETEVNSLKPGLIDGLNRPAVSENQSQNLDSNVVKSPGANGRPDSNQTGLMKKDTIKADKKRIYRNELILTLAYPFVRDIILEQKENQAAGFGTGKRAGLQGTRILAGINAWFRREKTFSFYMNGAAGFCSDYLQTIRYENEQGNFETRLNGNALVLTPKLEKIETVMRVQNFLGQAGFGISYRTFNQWEFRTGSTIRSVFISRSRIEENNKVSGGKLPVQTSLVLETGMAIPLEKIPEKWGKFRLELVINQDLNRSVFLGKTEKVRYSYGEIRLYKAFGS